MSTKFWIILPLFILFFSTNTYSGILFEPYVGYGMVSGEANGDGSVVTKNEYEINAPTYGAKVGGTLAGFMLGLDYRKLTGELEVKSTTGPVYQMLFPGVTSVTSKYDADLETIGLFAGYKFPFIKFWGEYYISGSLEVTPKAPTTGSMSTYTGSGYAVGAGFSLFPMLALNLEYNTITIDEVETNGVKTKLNNQEIEINTIFLFVSVPVDF